MEPALDGLLAIAADAGRAGSLFDVLRHRREAEDGGCGRVKRLVVGRVRQTIISRDCIKCKRFTIRQKARHGDSPTELYGGITGRLRNWGRARVAIDSIVISVDR